MEKKPSEWLLTSHSAPLVQAQIYHEAVKPASLSWPAAVENACRGYPQVKSPGCASRVEETFLYQDEVRSETRIGPRRAKAI